jgi:hypothetical protein
VVGVTSIPLLDFSKKKDPGGDAGARKGTGGRKIVSAVCLPGGPGDVMGVTKRRIAGVGGTEGQRLPGVADAGGTIALPKLFC